MVKLLKESKILWGKKEVHDDGQEYWLPLVAHLIDTKNVMNWLYTHWISNDTREMLCQDTSNDEMKKVVMFLGFSHDIGKASPGFQSKRSNQYNEQLDSDILEKLIQGGFDKECFEGLGIRESPHNLVGEALLESYGVNKYITSIIGGHHGMPASKSPMKKQLGKYSYNVYGYGEENDCHIWKKVQKNLFEYGLELSGYNDVKEIPEISKPQAVILEGLLIMADWFASSEYLNNSEKVSLFPLIRLDQNFDNLNMKARYQFAIKNWVVNDEWAPEYISSVSEQYRKRFGFTPRPFQKKVSTAIMDSKDPGIIIIEGPTGVGKTELALTAAEQLAFKTGENGLYMGLPTQATTNAMFDRVEIWLDKISKEQRVKSDIKLQQGKAEFNHHYTELPRAENINDEDGAVVVNSWFSGKKSSLVHFSVGTIDNLLLMGLKQKHLFLRHLGFSGKVVIIDELHAYDTYMSSYLEKAIEWLGAYHVPVIGLSATLPKKKRNDLLKAYCKGKYNTMDLIASIDWEDNNSYPLLSMLDGKSLIQVSNFKTTKDERREIKVIRLSDDNLVDKVLNEIRNGGVAGIIVNTVKRAQKLAVEIPDDIPSLILHSAFLTPDREKIEERLQKLIGKDAHRPEKMIIIGTQVLEQSLDIDFDVLFTDVAPIDLIIQRIGRLQRHDIKRPVSLTQPRVYITGINNFGDYGEANEYIYDKYLLMKTDLYLKNKIRIPDDVSSLVQNVYDLDKNINSEKMKFAREQFENKLQSKKDKADHFQISHPLHKRKQDLHGWLDQPKSELQTETRIVAAVRDIQETVEVILIKHTEEGNFLLDGRDINVVSSENIAEQTVRLPIGLTYNGLNIDKIIEQLEKKTKDAHLDWQQNIWLRGALVLPLNENNDAILNGYKLHYSTKFGLSYEKEE